MAPGHDHSIETLCRTLEVSRSGYYAHRNKPHKPRRQADQQLTTLINDSFQDSGQTYGCARVRKDLQEAGFACGKNRILRLMSDQGLRPRQKRRPRPRTTDSSHAMPTFPNWLGSVPAPDAPDRQWVADITYIHTRQEGTLYLAGVMDLYSRKIIGWSLGPTMEASLVEKAFAQAAARRVPGKGLIHHSDRGSQYTSHSFQQLLGSYGITCSMSRRGNCYDNAFKESFWATLKCECFGEKLPDDFRQVDLMLFAYIEGFYNRRRRHSSLGYLSPQQYEDQRMRSQAAPSATGVGGKRDAGEATSLLLADASDITQGPARSLAFGSVGRLPRQIRMHETSCGRLLEAPPEAKRKTQH